MGRCYTNPEPEEIDFVIPSNDGDTNNDDEKESCHAIDFDDISQIYEYLMEQKPRRR